MLVVAGAASALPAVSPVARAASAVGTSSCTVNWVGRAARPLWTNPENWSTGKLPGPADDVCITTTGDDVLTGISIKVHSLLLGPDQGIALAGTSSGPLTATVTTSVIMTPGGISRIDLTDARIIAARVNDRGGTISTEGNCNLTSPDVVFGAGAALQAADGTTTLTSLPQLGNGILTGASFTTSNAIVMLPGDVSHLVVPQLAVSPRTVTAGGKVTVSGGGFTYPQRVRVFLDHAVGTPLATTRARVRGAFVVTVTIPASATTGPHRLIAVESDGHRAATTISASDETGQESRSTPR